jgi:hypothetical protein
MTRIEDKKAEDKTGPIYAFMERNNGTWRVVKMDREVGIESEHEINQMMSCSCKAYKYSGDNECKHINYIANKNDWPRHTTPEVAKKEVENTLDVLDDWNIEFMGFREHGEQEPCKAVFEISSNSLSDDYEQLFGVSAKGDLAMEFNIVEE